MSGTKTRSDLSLAMLLAFLCICFSVKPLSSDTPCQNPLESIDWNPSGESWQESQNEIISDLSLAMFLAHFLISHSVYGSKNQNKQKT